MIIQASMHEAMVLHSNVGNHPAMLAVVLGMLSIRVGQDAPGSSSSAPSIQKLKDQALFKQKMSVVGAALTSLQNCSVKPPLTQGEAYVLDQVAVIQLPELVRDLFETAGFEPVVALPYSERDWGTLLTTRHLYQAIGLKSGFSFTFIGESKK